LYPHSGHPSFFRSVWALWNLCDVVLHKRLFSLCDSSGLLCIAKTPKVINPKYTKFGMLSIINDALLSLLMGRGACSSTTKTTARQVPTKRGIDRITNSMVCSPANSTGLCPEILVVVPKTGVIIRSRIFR